LYSEETGILTPLFDVDTYNGQRIPGPPRPAHKPSELQQRILQSGAQLILRQPSSAFLPGTATFGDHARPSASLLFVPVRSQARPVGILTAQSYTPDAYDQQDLRTLQTLADLCGGALERIRVNEALRKSEAQLFQSQKMETVGKLAGGVAHEFNSILTAIIGQSELMLQDLPAGSPLTENTAEIIKAAKRAATLTRQLLAYGRKQLLQPEALDLNRVLSGMDGVLGHLMGGQKVTVNFVPTPGLRAVKADAGQIEQVIMNLAMNARDAMPNGGKLTLETANVTLDAESVGHFPELKPGDYVLLAVSDTGAGMSDAVKARAFEPFFSTKGVGQGTGLGLSTCYGIVKQSGGHLSLYSELGRGTTCKIYLPQAEPMAKLPPARLDAPGLPRGTETILLVEDDPALREMAATLLKRLGYEVRTAANGVEALSLQHAAGAGHIDLLFTDVVMPHMSGSELADRVRALYPQTKILFTSAYTEQSIIHQGVLAQGMTLLQKPFTPSALAHKLREVLDGSGAP
jgi:signal transduction histidine kinase